MKKLTEEQTAILEEIQVVSEKEGWGIFLTDEDENHAPFELQRLDDEAIFPCDREAMLYVVKKALEGSPIHEKTLLFIKNNAPHEYGIICLHATREGLILEEE